MFEDDLNPERFRIKGTVQGTDEHPYFSFVSEIYYVLIPDDLERVKAAAEQFQEFFGLRKWEVQVFKTRDKWETVRFDD